jgi:hypothetical protein
MADLQREQELKRCGWTFVRVRESSFYLDRERALVPIWAELDRLGIAPFGGPGSDGTAHSTPATRSDSPHESLLPTPTGGPGLAPASQAELRSPKPRVVDALVEEADRGSASALQEEPIEAVEPIGIGQVTRDVDDPAASARSAPRASELKAPNDEARELLLQMAGRAPLSSAKVAEILVIGREEARAILNAMALDGSLVRTGQSRGHRYVLPGWSEVTRHDGHSPVTDASGPSTATRPSRNLVVGPEQRSAVLRAAKYRALTNEVVRNLLNVDASTAFEILTALVEDGKLRRKGQGRGTHYVLPKPTNRPPPQAVLTQQINRDEVATSFEREMASICRRAEREIGYRPSYLLRMLNERGAVGSAQQLLQPGPLAHGFTSLWERRRLDLTVESLVLEPRFSCLFSEQELEVARNRLERASSRRGQR